MRPVLGANFSIDSARRAFSYTCHEKRETVCPNLTPVQQAVSV